MPAYTDPNQGIGYLESGSDSAGKFLALNPKCFGGDNIDFYIGSHFPGDEQFEGRSGKALAFELRGGYTGPLTLLLMENDRLIGGKTYSSDVPTEPARDGWSTVVIPLSAFKDEAGSAPASWAEIDKVNLKGCASKRNPPRFKGFRWVDEPRP